MGLGFDEVEQSSWFDERQCSSFYHISKNFIAVLEVLVKVMFCLNTKGKLRHKV